MNKGFPEKPTGCGGKRRVASSVCGSQGRCQWRRSLHQGGANSVYQVDELKKGILGRGNGEFQESRVGSGPGMGARVGRQ